MGEHRRKADGRRVFSTEFKRATVQRILTGEKTLAELSRELDISPSVLRNWKRFAEAGATTEVQASEDVVPASQWLSANGPQYSGEHTKSRTRSPARKTSCGANRIGRISYSRGFLMATTHTEGRPRRPRPTTRSSSPRLALLAQASYRNVRPTRTMFVRGPIWP
jgi:transposase-like protein